MAISNSYVKLPEGNQQSHHGIRWAQGLEKSPATLRQQLVVISEKCAVWSTIKQLRSRRLLYNAMYTYNSFKGTTDDRHAERHWKTKTYQITSKHIKTSLSPSVHWSLSQGNQDSSPSAPWPQLWQWPVQPGPDGLGFQGSHASLREGWTMAKRLVGSSSLASTYASDCYETDCCFRKVRCGADVVSRFRPKEPLEED